MARILLPDDKDKAQGQSYNGRLWDVFSVMRYAARKAEGDTIRFTVAIRKGRRSYNHNLWCKCGPGDTPEPVLTIMLEGED